MPSTIDLHVEHYGAGSPTIVLMHGFGGSARNFRAQARELKARYHVILFDARGHARSAAPSDPAEYEPNCFVEDTLRVLDERAVGPCIVGGLSMGAGIALRFAIAHPEVVRALVLCAFPPSGDRSPSSWALRFANAIEARGLEESGSEFVWGGDRFDNDAARFIRQGFLEHRPHALVAILRNVIAAQPDVADLRDELDRIAIPTLVIAGKRDRASLEPSRELARRIRGAEFFEVPDAGHVVNLEKPKAFNDILGGFLGGFEA